MKSAVTPDIEAEISLLEAEDGGRLGAILRGEYRGVIGVNAEHFSVRFAVEGDVDFGLGSSKFVGIQFLFPDAALPHFSTGTRFTVWEGGTVGLGRVIKILK